MLFAHKRMSERNILFTQIIEKDLNIFFNPYKKQIKKLQYQSCFNVSVVVNRINVNKYNIELLDSDLINLHL